MDYENDRVYLQPSAFADIWVFTCRVGKPDIKIGVYDMANINIGGYGLFE